ncbi:hypothetical protein KFE25_010169 [Diacronema lutheri]|uniref:Poly A polymerase head domain-containing protein n=1 Tax=Diacronema lutheri TaxID=2081491 RepID=A0A8J5XAA2_DIALT|nr:hypothetical protein KFE25_010169 [Diacronema lutheri]
MADDGVQLSLTREEEALFDLLCDVVARNGLATVPRVAGGWVRDKLLGKASADIDIALDDMTGVAFSELVNARLAELGRETRSLGVISANPEQSKHLETVSLRVLGFELDVVNLRSESYADGSRIPTVEFGSPRADAERRDLTINALFYNLCTRRVEDLCGRGLADLRARLCRTPLDASRTFLDDPLRVLRAARFAARLGFALAPDLVAAARTVDVQDALRTKVSRERVLIELGKMLSTARPIGAFRLLRCMGLLPAVFDMPDGCAHARRAAEAAVADDAGAWPPVDARADARFRARFDDECAACAEALDVAIGWEAAAALGGAAGGSETAGAPALVTVEPAADARRLLWLAAALLPALGLVAPLGSKQKPAPLAEVVLRGAFPGLSSADIATVLRLHASIPELARWCSRAELPAELSRLQLGLRLRDAGPHWRAALALALVAAAPPLDAADAMPSAADLDAARIDAARAAWRASAAPHAAAAALIVRRADELGLSDAHALRPLLDGAELMREAGVPKGPAVGRASRELLEFQLAHRHATRDEAIAHLRACAW